MNSYPLVSVIIPAYNAEQFIAETLDHIIAQTYENIEIIVVNDGSSDGTAKIVRGYEPHVQFYEQKNSGGCAVPRNHGIHKSSGSLLCFIDADDLMTPDRIARQVDFLDSHPEVGIVFSDYRNFTTGGQYPVTHFQTCPHLWPLLKDRSELVLDDARPFLAEENFGISGSFLFRRELLYRVPGFEPTLKACEDFHFYYRLVRYSRAGIMNHVGMLRRLHANNMSGNSTLMAVEGIRSYGMLLEAEDNPQAKKHLKSKIADCWSDRARLEANRGDFLNAARHYLTALAADFHLERLLDTLWGLARTFALLAGVHDVKDE